METEGSPDRTTINWRPLRWAADRTPHSPQNGVGLQAIVNEYIRNKFKSMRDPFQRMMFNMVTSSILNDIQIGKISLGGLATDQQMGQIALLALNRVQFKTYTSAIEEFTRRTLSSPDDGINAVHGVLDTLSSQLGAFHCGLPESYLGPALLWTPLDYDIADIYDYKKAPFPSFTWARWRLPQGAAWPLPRISWIKLATQAFLLTQSRLVELHAPYDGSRLEAPIVKFNRFSPKTQMYLATFGHTLFMNTTPVRLCIGDRITPIRRSPEPANTVFQYYLLHPRGFVVGYVRLSAEERQKCGENLQELLTICWSTGYDGPEVPNRFIGTKKINQGTEESPKYETVKLQPKEYRVASVFLIKWIDEIAERVALGHVVSEAWEACRERSRWTILG